MRINRNIWLPIKHEAERVDLLAYGRQAKTRIPCDSAKLTMLGRGFFP